MEPLRSFIYAPEPEGEREGRQECTTLRRKGVRESTALKCSRLTSSLSPRTAVIVSE